MAPDSRIIEGVELPRWPQFSAKRRRNAQEMAELYRTLCFCRLTLFKSRGLNARFEELALTQNYRKVTLYHFLYLMIPAGFLGIATADFENHGSMLRGLIVLVGGLGIGVTIAYWLPRFLWSQLGFYAHKGMRLMDDTKAANLWREAALQGGAFAQAALGFMYQNGKGVSQDAATAAQWYRRSAEQGCDLGKYLLASLYEHGLGVEQNAVEAYMWYSLSFPENIPAELELHAKNLTAAQITEAKTRAAAFAPKREIRPPVAGKVKPRSRLKFIVLFVVPYVAVTILSAGQLNQLENHQHLKIVIWWPAVAIYQSWGYWPAVLFTPALGFAVLGMAMWSIRLKAKKSATISRK